MLQPNSAFDPATAYAKVSEQNRLSEILSSYADSIEFAHTIAALRNSQIEIPTEMLRKASQGPVDALSEDETSNAGRNFMFELVIAAMVARAGFTPVVGGEPDVVFEFEGRRVLIECKRVMSVNKVEERIRQALRQIKSHVQHATDCGLIAISITRTVNSGGVIWEVESEAEIEEFFERQNARFDQSIRSPPSGRLKHKCKCRSVLHDHPHSRARTRVLAGKERHGLSNSCSDRCPLPGAAHRHAQDLSRARKICWSTSRKRQHKFRFPAWSVVRSRSPLAIAPVDR